MLSATSAMLRDRPEQLGEHDMTFRSLSCLYDDHFTESGLHPSKNTTAKRIITNNFADRWIAHQQQTLLNVTSSTFHFSETDFRCRCPHYPRNIASWQSRYELHSLPHTAYNKEYMTSMSLNCSIVTSKLSASFCRSLISAPSVADGTNHCAHRRLPTPRTVEDGHVRKQPDLVTGHTTALLETVHFVWLHVNDELETAILVNYNILTLDITGCPCLDLNLLSNYDGTSKFILLSQEDSRQRWSLLFAVTNVMALNPRWR